MMRRFPVPSSQTPEAMPNTAGASTSGKLPSGFPRPLGAFLEILGDTIAVVGLFALLFAGLAIEWALS